jgi:hypothetical protein
MLFTSSTNLLNRIAFSKIKYKIELFRLIPFLNELKATLDWTVASTSLDLYQWIKLDDAQSNLYVCRCQMDLRKQISQGAKRETDEKILFGVSSVIAIILIIGIFYLKILL